MTGRGPDLPVGEASNSDEFESAIRTSKREVFRRLIDRWCEAEPGRMQLHLAASLGVHPVTLSRWRSGERTVPDWVLATVSDRVGVEVSLDAVDGWSVSGGDS